MHKLTILDDGEYDYVEFDKGRGDMVELMLPTGGMDFHSYNQEQLDGVPRHEAKRVLYKLLFGNVEVIRKET